LSVDLICWAWIHLSGRFIRSICRAWSICQARRFTSSRSICSICRALSICARLLIYLRSASICSICRLPVHLSASVDLTSTLRSICSVSRAWSICQARRSTFHVPFPRTMSRVVHLSVDPPRPLHLFHLSRLVPSVRPADPPFTPAPSVHLLGPVIYHACSFVPSCRQAGSCFTLCRFVLLSQFRLIHLSRSRHLHDCQPPIHLSRSLHLFHLRALVHLSGFRFICQAC
jgi:hypothetical protein